MTETGQAPQDGSAPSAPAENVPQPNPAIPLAVDIGWTMAVLSGALRAIASKDQSTVSGRLPTEHELSATDRKDLEEGRVNVLLARLGGLLPANPAAESGVPQVQLNGSDAGEGATPAQEPDPAAAKSDQELLTEANLGILEWLACAGREFGLAYQLGLALRDTANPPFPAGADPTVTRDALVKQLSRSRVATIQDWLTTLDPDLPDSSARIVSVSLGRWARPHQHDLR